MKDLNVNLLSPTVDLYGRSLRFENETDKTWTNKSWLLTQRLTRFVVCYTSQEGIIGLFAAVRIYFFFQNTKLFFFFLAFFALLRPASVMWIALSTTRTISQIDLQRQVEFRKVEDEEDNSVSLDKPGSLERGLESLVFSWLKRPRQTNHCSCCAQGIRLVSCFLFKDWSSTMLSPFQFPWLAHCSLN